MNAKRLFSMHFRKKVVSFIIITIILSLFLLPLQYREVKSFPFQIVDDNIIFSPPQHYKHIRWEIRANGATATDNLMKYCTSSQCKIQSIFGRNQSIHFFYKNKEVFRSKFEITNGRFTCYGYNWSNRICRFKDICFDNGTLTLLAPYKVTPELPFATIGARTPPYDRKKDRQIDFNINISTRTLAPSRQILENTTIYTSVFHNSHMLWHVLFDFTLPLFHTMLQLNLEDKMPDVIVTPHGGKINDKQFKKIFKSFTNSVFYLKTNACYRDLILGITKVKENDGIDYMFPKNFTYKLVQKLYNYFNLTEIKLDKPRVVLVNRFGTRKIVNSQELLEELRKLYPKYDFEEIYLEKMPIEWQISNISTCDILIGAHGSGLAHVAWMKSGKQMIEIFPYQFNCKNWYKKAVDVSGVKYSSYMPESPEESANITNGLETCWEKKDRCEGRCHDKLRDQDIRIDIKNFIKKTAKVFKRG